MPETVPVGEIVEAGIGSLPYLALHVSDLQGSADDLAEKLERHGGHAEFVEFLYTVAGYAVRL